MALGGLGWQGNIWERARVGYRTLRPSRGGVYGFAALEPRVDVDGLTSKVKVKYFTVYTVKYGCGLFFDFCDTVGEEPGVYKCTLKLRV